MLSKVGTNGFGLGEVAVFEKQKLNNIMKLISDIQYKRGRKSNYLKSLNNENHREVRNRALIREDFHCKLCEKRIRLELHHIDYEFLGKELENMQWVVILCEDHHQYVHNTPGHKWNPYNFKRTDINGILKLAA